MGDVNVVDLVLVQRRAMHGVFREPAFKMAQARLAEGLTLEDLQKAIICGHVKAVKPEVVIEEEPAPQKTSTRRRSRKKGRAT